MVLLEDFVVNLVGLVINVVIGVLKNDCLDFLGVFLGWVFVTVICWLVFFLYYSQIDLGVGWVIDFCVFFDLFGMSIVFV